MATIDLRSLALCRITAGLVIIGDLLSRWPDFFIHYTDQGILPRQLLYEAGVVRFPSLHFMSGSELYLAFLFFVHALVGLSLSAGYHTRWSGFLAWYLTLSLQERCFMANNGGDRVLATVLFWGMFLPWGESLSIDAAQRKDQTPSTYQVRSVATAIFCFQPVSLYLISVFHKIEPTWLSGKVLHYALQSDFYAYPLSWGLLAHPQVMTGLAYTTLAWECVGPFLLLSTNPYLRGSACLGFSLMHLSFGLFLRIGIFSFSPLLYMIGIAPSAVWQTRVGARLQKGLEDIVNSLAPRCPQTRSLPMKGRLSTDFVLGALFLYASAISIFQDERFKTILPEKITAVAHLTGLYQRWTVFVDTPQIFDGWIVVEAVLADGRRVDIFQGHDPVRWGKPDTPYHRYRSFRWPTPLAIISDDRVFFRPFVQALAKDWQRDHRDDHVVWARFVLFRETPWLDYQTPSVQRHNLWEGNL